jgi:hypothetical protein
METLLSGSKDLFILAQIHACISLYLIFTHSGSYLTFLHVCFLLFVSVGTPEKITSTVWNTIIEKNKCKKWDIYRDILCLSSSRFLVTIQLNSILKTWHSNGEEIPFLTNYTASIVFTLWMLKQYRHFNFP